MAITERDSQYLFQYLNDLWDLLPEADRIRFGETWKGFEQTYGSVWMKMFERDMATNIDFLPLYNNQRWLAFTFDADTEVLRAATYRSPQDLSAGINLSSRYLIRFALNGGSPVEIDLRGAIPLQTSLAEIISAINAGIGAVVGFAVAGNQLLEIRSNLTGPSSSLEFLPVSDPTRDATEIVLGLDPVTEIPLLLPEFPYEFQLPDRMITAIPRLQTKIHDDDDTVYLTEDVDYAVEFGTGVISFKVMPPLEKLWAADTLFNLETPYNNYGFLMDLYDNNTESYLKAVKGLWFAFWTGPRPENIRRSLYLLFGLPTASNAGVVTQVTPTQITLRYGDGTTEVFAIPAGLSALVVPDQTVSRFEPLVSGIQVFDKINYPGFMTKEAGRIAVEPFLTESATRGVGPDTDETRALRLLEEHTYLPQIDVNTFISPDIRLGNVQTFLRNIQPKSRTYLFQVLVGVFRDLVVIRDDGQRGAYDADFPNGLPALQFDITFDVTPNVDYNPNTEAELDELEDAETNPYTYLTLDSEVFTYGDYLTVEVRHFGSLVDQFDVQG